jgi:tryptophan halogenase
VDNVVAIGNAAGFVEPLEATALMIVCSHTETIIQLLSQSRLQPTPTIRALFNDITSDNWQDIRDFLAIHYKFNTARDTPFWRHCQNDTDVSRVQGLLDFYAENGPSNFCRYRMPSIQSDFGSEGFLVMLVGNRVPYAARHQPGADELRIWNAHRAGFSQLAGRGMGVKEALGYVHHPGWQWHGDAGKS